MSLLDLLGPKCKLCKGRNTDRVLTVPYHGHYSTLYKSWHYHEKCLQDVLNNPIPYGHETVDIAIEISERIIEVKKEQEKHERFLEKKRNEQVAKIQQLRHKIEE
jgi:hypothetical protein